MREGGRGGGRERERERERERVCVFVRERVIYFSLSIYLSYDQLSSSTFAHTPQQTW